MAIQECTLKVTFTNMERLKFTFLLEESPAFEYGNNTCVVVRSDGSMPRTIDTRYDASIKKDDSDAFDEWCSNWVRSNYDNVFMVEHTVQL